MIVSKATCGLRVVRPAELSLLKIYQRLRVELEETGDIAGYLLYAHARICSIIEQSGKDIDELKKTGKLVLDHADERALRLHLLRFSETVKEALQQIVTERIVQVPLQPIRILQQIPLKSLSGYLFGTSRLLLCEATAIVMQKCFHLLGITPVYKL